MKVVLFCGGRGLRWSAGGAESPKVLARIGDRPLVWHVMSTYSRSGFREFVICLGHLGDQIVRHFEEAAGARRDADGRVTLRVGPGVTWDVWLRETGQEAQTGGRLMAVARLLDGRRFLASYGDGVADLDVRELVGFHARHRRMATLTAARPRSPFGMLEIDPAGRVCSFVEKPLLPGWVNGGFFVFEPEVLPALDQGPLESGVLPRLAEWGELVAYRTTRFWACVDTPKESAELDRMVREGTAPWLHPPGVTALSS
jgi:glucose-1-phosphate cytidylyltransferase